MNTLANKEIILSKKGDSAMSQQDAEELLQSLSGWSIIHDNGMDKLVKIYELDDYKQTMSLTNKFGLIAEQYNHHPVIVTEWGKVTVTWWTHVIGGLHLNDFIMAAKCDRIAMLIQGL